MPPLPEPLRRIRSPRYRCRRPPPFGSSRRRRPGLRRRSSPNHSCRYEAVPPALDVPEDPDELAPDATPTRTRSRRWTTGSPWWSWSRSSWSCWSRPGVGRRRSRSARSARARPRCPSAASGRRTRPCRRTAARPASTSALRARLPATRYGSTTRHRRTQTSSGSMRRPQCGQSLRSFWQSWSHQLQKRRFSTAQGSSDGVGASGRSCADDLERLAGLTIYVNAPGLGLDHDLAPGGWRPHPVPLTRPHPEPSYSRAPDRACVPVSAPCRLLG